MSVVSIARSLKSSSQSNKQHKLQLPSRPSVPLAPLSPRSIVTKLQHDIRTNHSYNDTGKPTINVNKEQSYATILKSASHIHKGMPIQCVEATYLALLKLDDHNHRDIVRFPMSFKLLDERGGFHKHLVLGIKVGRYYGAIGISREPTLGSKPLEYDSLYSLLCSYAHGGRLGGSIDVVASQQGCTMLADPYHLLAVKLGSPIYRNAETVDQVPVWHHTIVPFRCPVRAKRDLERYDNCVLKRGSFSVTKVTARRSNTVS
eukprot:PhF_6_TR41825/c0_g1_i1/m.63432